MATSETDLREQLADLDWGTTPAPAIQVTEPAGDVFAPLEVEASNALDFDVGVEGVAPTPAPRKARKARVKRQPKAQELLDAVTAGQTVEAAAPGKRRPRTAVPDVLVAAGETAAVQKLFDTMWKDAGQKLARSIGRSKASRQDAAIGWYMMLLAMRERDAK